MGDEAVFRPKLFITREVFERRMAFLRRQGVRVLPLDQAVNEMYEGRLPDNSVSITIDDGFHSVAGVAAPVLSRHGFPSTVYVTSYYVKHAVPVFRLVVQYMFWKTGCRRISFVGCDWHPDGEIDLSNSSSRERLAEQCIRHGEALEDEDQRMRLCKQLGQLLDVPFQGIVEQRILHLMTPEELRGLRAHAMDVQLHTHRHRFPLDSEAGARQEIEDNRRSLAEWLPSAQFVHFCYPSGIWDSRQWQCLDAMGVKSATTCVPGLNSAATPRHALHRFLDGDDIHPLEFEAAVSGFSDLIMRRM
ncbi:polysaccharide deacetylase family protein [Piscinibacter defluvii]|uniref:polysaccharide deacetylase family protein n=1 Tax=Piscinibacter defluvii TaxID=1796922 RepID=UPI0013E3E7D6|nr:polysaccharide deacetylase family protein [Piscinibacter defluvii]